MMLYHQNAEVALDELLKRQNVTVPESIKLMLYSFICQMYVYEIEEKKQHPKLIIGNNIDCLLCDPVKWFVFFKFSTSEKDVEKSIEKKIKSLVPFCNNGWFILFLVDRNTLSLGIVKIISGAITESLEEFFNSADMADNTSIIMIWPSTKYEIEIWEWGSNVLGNMIKISRRFCNYKNTAPNLSVVGIVDVCTSQYRTDIKPRMKQAISSIMNEVIEHCHGAILVIMDSLTDEQWRANSFIQNNQINPIAEKVAVFKPLESWILALDNSSIDHTSMSRLENIYRENVKLFFEMLDVDGFTLMTKEGDVIAFNCFISQTQNINCAGGARRRAYETIKYLKQQDASLKILAAMFLSQDKEIDFC